jgi:hypothetical protein
MDFPRRHVLVLALVPLLAAAGARRAAACASCGCGDPTLTATGVERPYRNRIRLAIEERYGSTSMGDGTYGDRTDFLRSSLAASWSPARRVTIAALLPWVSSWIANGSRPRAEVQGLGDLELSARAVAFAERSFAPHHVLWLGGGLKMPTGYHTTDSQGYPVPDDDQPGSGSWDPFAGVTYGWFSGGLLSFFASTAGRYTTRGWHGYRRGSTVAGSMALQLQPWSWGALQLGADVSWQQSDTLGNGATMPNTGGTVGYLALAVLVNPWRDLLVRLVTDAPLVTELRGVQSVGPQVALQLSYDFN